MWVRAVRAAGSLLAYLLNFAAERQPAQTVRRAMRARSATAECAPSLVLSTLHVRPAGRSEQTSALLAQSISHQLALLRGSPSVPVPRPVDNDARCLAGIRDSVLLAERRELLPVPLRHLELDLNLGESDVAG